MRTPREPNPRRALSSCCCGGCAVAATTFLIRQVRLLCLARADVSATADGGGSALHVAARGGSVAHADVARILVAYGASASHTDLRGATPLGVARASGGVEVAAVIYAAAHNGLDERGHVEAGVPAAAPWRPVGP